MIELEKKYSAIGYGFHVRCWSMDGNQELIMGHLHPESEAAKDFQYLLRLAKKVGKDHIFIPKGTVLGEMASAGYAIGPHVHWEIREYR